MSDYWGYHGTFDCKSCNKDLIKSEENLKGFLADLVHKIDMKAYGDPILAHFANHDPSKGGYTILQMIETSTITGHFIDSNGDCYIDVFSCKPFSIDVAADVVNVWFKPEKMTVELRHRQA